MLGMHFWKNNKFVKVDFNLQKPRSLSRIMYYLD